MTCEIGPACECDDHGKPRVDTQQMLDMREKLSTTYRNQLERLCQRGLLKPRAVNDLCAEFADGLAAMVAAVVAGTAEHGVATAVNAAFPQASGRPLMQRLSRYACDKGHAMPRPQPDCRVCGSRNIYEGTKLLTLSELAAAIDAANAAEGG